jgi:DNA polymerase-1
VFVVVSASVEGAVLRELDDSLTPTAEPVEVPLAQFAVAAAERERRHPRWVWDDTERWYPLLLAERVRIERCIDLRLSHAILRGSVLTAGSRLAASPPSSWDRAAPESIERVDDALFDFDREPDGEPEDVLAEFLLQREAIAGATDAARLGLLLAAESAGALVAAEMFYAGLPWRADVHDSILAGHLGPRPADGERPEKLRETLDRLRVELGSPELNPDSPPDCSRRSGARA